MIVKTRIFELCAGNYKNLSELAQTMGISVSQIYRVREGKRQINQKFIIGAIKAFPNYKLDDLFYLVPEPPIVNNRPYSAIYPTDKPAAKDKQISERTQQAMWKFASATKGYGQHLKSHTRAISNLNEALQEIKMGIAAANRVLSYLTNSHN